MKSCADLCGGSWSQLAPILAGDMAAILLYGVLLSTFASFVRSVTWTRSPLLTRSVVIIVMLLTTAVTALYCKDIWDFGTHAPATTRQYVEQGNFGSATQPVFLVVVATIVQSVLVRRAANVSLRSVENSATSRRASSLCNELLTY